LIKININHFFNKKGVDRMEGIRKDFEKIKKDFKILESQIKSEVNNESYCILLFLMFGANVKSFKKKIKNFSKNQNELNQLFGRNPIQEIRNMVHEDPKFLEYFKKYVKKEKESSREIL